MNPGHDLMGIILAAGKGARMYPFSERMPKSLLPILNRPLLAHQLDRMSELGIKKVLIVIGHYGFEIVSRIGDGSDWGVEIEYMDQQETLGIAHALGKLEPRVDRPFLLFLGDIFFHSTDGLQSMISPVLEGKANGVLAAKREEDVEAVKRNFAIIADDDGLVSRVVEKPRHSKTNLKGCGLYAFDLHVFDAVRRTPRTAARDEYEITDSIDLFIKDGYRVEVRETIEYDVNLTFPEDVLKVNQRELSRLGKKSIVGQGFSGPPLESIERSVIGSNVSLPETIKVKDAVIFDKVKIGAGRDISSMIVTPGGRVSLSVDS